jgi:hypothetical protein
MPLILSARPGGPSFPNGPLRFAGLCGALRLSPSPRRADDEDSGPVMRSPLRRRLRVKIDHQTDSNAKGHP